MITIAYIILLISIVLLFSTREKFIYFLIPLNFSIDLMSGFFEKGGVLAITRVIIVFTFFLLVYFKYDKVLIPLKLRIPIYIFLSYLFVLVILSDNNSKALTEYLKTVIILSSFLVSYKIFAFGNDINRLFKSFYYVLFLTIINIFISNFYDFGWGGYSPDIKFYSGSIWANVWYTPALAIIIGFELLRKGFTKWRKLILLILSINLILLILSARRSALIIIIIAIFMFLYLANKKFDLLKTLLVIIMIIISAFPLYEDILLAQYESRVRIFDEGLTSENRYLETLAVWEEILSFENPKVSLAGRSPFDTQGNYGGGFLGQRYLHIDINVIVFSSGIFGLLLYMLIYYQIFDSFVISLKKRNNVDINEDKINLKYIFLSFFFVLLMLSFSGGLNAISYRSSAFIVIGAVLGHWNYKIRAINKK